MDTKYLEYIISIADHQSMTKAAQELYVSQSSLSQYLSKLEKELGCPLFYRSKGSLTLTGAGQMYVDAAREVLRIKTRLYDRIQNTSFRDHIMIGVTSQFGLRMLTEIIPALKKVYPDVSLEISELSVPTTTKMIQEESLDCAIMALENTAAFGRGQVDILRQEEVFWAVPSSHPFCAVRREGSVSLQDLNRYFSTENVLMTKKGSSLRPLTDQVIESASLMLNTVCETNSILASRSMVAMGIGSALIPDSCREADEHICYYAFDPPVFRLNAFVCRKNWTMKEPEQYLRELVLAYFK